MFHISAQIVFTPPRTVDVHHRKPPVSPAYHIYFPVLSICIRYDQPAFLHTSVRLRVVRFPSAYDAVSFSIRRQLYPTGSARIKLHTGYLAGRKSQTSQFTLNITVEIAYSLLVQLDLSFQSDGTGFDHQTTLPAYTFCRYTSKYIYSSSVPGIRILVETDMSAIGCSPLPATRCTTTRLPALLFLHPPRILPAIPDVNRNVYKG